MPLPFDAVEPPESRFCFCRWNFSNNSPPPLFAVVVGLLKSGNDAISLEFMLAIFSQILAYLLPAPTKPSPAVCDCNVAVFCAAGNCDNAIACCCCCCCATATRGGPWAGKPRCAGCSTAPPTAVVGSCVWLGTSTTRSVSESRRELFAVDGVVLGLSRPALFAA